MLALKHKAELKLYALPGLTKQVEARDTLYFQDLIPDLVNRAKASPDALFRQLCGLSAGPLLADEVIEIENSESAIAERFPGLEVLD